MCKKILITFYSTWLRKKNTTVGLGDFFFFFLMLIKDVSFLFQMGNAKELEQVLHRIRIRKRTKGFFLPLWFVKIMKGEFACLKDHFNLISEFQCNEYFNDSNWNIFLCVCVRVYFLKYCHYEVMTEFSLWTPCHAQRMKNILFSRENWKLFFLQH